MGDRAADVGRWIAASEEVTAARELLDHADALVGGLTFIHRDTHVLTAVLATGVEKLLKLTYGFTIADRDGAWPNLRPFGHRLADLDTECRVLLRSRLHLAASPRYIAGLLSDVEEDPFITALLDVCQRYAVDGRFYNLDHMGERPQPEPPPSQHWERISLSIPIEGLTQEQVDAYDQRRRLALRQSLLKWREFYWRAWIHGVCGVAARPLGWELQPQAG